MLLEHPHAGFSLCNGGIGIGLGSELPTHVISMLSE